MEIVYMNLICKFPVKDKKETAASVLAIIFNDFKMI